MKIKFILAALIAFFITYLYDPGPAITDYLKKSLLDDIGQIKKEVQRMKQEIIVLEKARVSKESRLETLTISENKPWYPYAVWLLSFFISFTFTLIIGRIFTPKRE